MGEGNAGEKGGVVDRGMSLYKAHYTTHRWLCLIHTKTVFYEISIIFLLIGENLGPHRLNNLLIFSRAQSEVVAKSWFKFNLSSSRAQFFSVKIEKKLWKAVNKKVKRIKYFQSLKIFKIKTR